MSLDRIIRGTVKVKQACVTLFGTTQPALMEKMSNSGHLDRLMIDGFFQRIQMPVWADAPRNFAFIDHRPDEDAMRNFKEMLSQFAFCLGGHFTSIDPLGPKPITFRFGKKAMSRYEKWTYKNAHAQAQLDLPSLVEYRHKLESFVPAASLVMELADRFNRVEDEGQFVGLRSLEKAIRLAEYCAAHANRIYSQSMSSSIKKATQLRDRILDGSLTSPFTLRDVYRPNWKGLTTKQEAIQAVRALIEYNWVAEESSQAVDKPRAKFIVNPNQPS